MPDDRGRMTADEFRAALERMDETQSSFAALLVDIGGDATVSLRTVQRWAAAQQDIPGLASGIIALLELLNDVGIDTDTVRDLCRARDDRRGEPRRSDPCA